MRVFVIGLDCAAPEILFTHPELPNIRALMKSGSYGRLESVVPPITVPAWMCMATSQDPGSLGVYGFRNRADHSYSALSVVNSASFTAPAVWDVLAARGLRSVVVGLPPSYPPRKLNGVNIGCFLTPDTDTSPYTHPASLRDDIRHLVGDYPVDVRGFRTGNKEWLRDRIHEMTRKHFEVIRYLLVTEEWDYFHFVEIGLDRIHHGFWKYHDKLHRQYESGSPFETTIWDYYKRLDEEIGKTLQLIEQDTTVLVVSDHGAQRLDGGFCVNQWLAREGLLVLKDQPSKPAPLKPEMVDWPRTKVWSEGGYYARVFFNIAGREPDGAIEPAAVDSFRSEMEERLRALPDDSGKPMGTQVFRPDRIYKEVHNVAPDLIVHFGGLYWRSIGGVGYDRLHVQENDTGPDDCNHAQFGAYLVSGPGAPATGESQGAHLLDVAPSVLSLMGIEAPACMQGRNLAGLSKAR